MKLLIVLGNYLPKMQANGICTNEVIKELIKRGHEIHVLCYSDTKANERAESLNGVQVHRVRAPRFNRYRTATNDDKKELIWKFRYNYNKLITRISTLFYFPLYPLNSIKMVYRYYKKAKEIYRSEKFNLVLGVYKPFEAIIASTLIGRNIKEVKSGIYILDTLIDQQANSIIKWWFDKSGWLWEKKLYKYNDFIINMISYEKTYKNSRYDIFKSKMFHSDIPLYIAGEIALMDRTLKSNKVKWLYAGTLNKNNRNPEYLCRLFTDKQICANNELHFYSTGDCEDIIAECSKNVSEIFQHGFVNRSKILKEFEEADVLVSIGNRKSNMVPSKIFEYISTGKRIIHLYSDNNDSCLKYLRKYRNALLVDEKVDIGHNTAIIKDFIESQETIVDLKCIDNEFELNKPSHTADIIEKFIN